MFAPILPLPGAISELFAQASATGKLTQADRYGIQAAILSGELSQEEQSSLDRLLHAVVRQRIVITDDLSVVR